MHANHLYLLHWARKADAVAPGARILDYGCGAGEVVVAGRRQGLDIVGADVFYEGASSKREVEAQGLLGTVITEMKNGKLEHDDATFDLILSNQVIEHTADLDAVLAEISRVMKPAAKLLCIFPTREVVREGHTGIPFVHWFAKGSPSRFQYALVCRAIGFGYFKKGKPTREWTRDALKWIDDYTFYRTRTEILDTFRTRFSVTMIEPDYVQFRIRSGLGTQDSRLLSSTFALPVVSQLAGRALSRLSGMTLLATKS
jgi:SAM-dependent methyltransferase